jgi:DNA modification methylase
MHLDELLNLDAVSGLSMLPDACIAMTLTSPPYDELLEYGGHTWDLDKFKAVADGLWRVTQPGGVVVWVVKDSIVGGGESGSTDEQKSFFRTLGLTLYQTLYLVATSPRATARRYCRQTSLAMVFSKGRPRSVDLLCDRPNATAGQVNRMSYRRRDGTIKRCSDKVVRDHGVRFDAWHVSAGWGKTTRDSYVFGGHPAPMAETVARDLIVSWSRPGEVILDPFVGSGTTPKMAILSHRRFLGFEIHEPYFQLAQRRVADARAECRRRLDDWLVGT